VRNAKPCAYRISMGKRSTASAGTPTMRIKRKSSVYAPTKMC
jgi:hypothetical protein